MNLEVFDHKIKPNGDIEINLLGKLFIRLPKDRILKLLSLYLTKADLKTIHNLTESNSDIDTEETRVKELIRVYFSNKKAFFKNKNIAVTEVKRGSPQYKSFCKALEIIDAHAVSYDQFIKAQVKGLSFANVFPKPNQLCTEDAETRLLAVVAAPMRQATKLIKLTPDDYQLPLKDNKKFQNVYRRILAKAETVPMEELIYVSDVIVARGKNVPDSIKQKIEMAKEDR
jgi:hypothetical protein